MFLSSEDPEVKSQNFSVRRKIRKRDTKEGRVERFWQNNSEEKGGQRMTELKGNKKKYKRELLNNNSSWRIGRQGLVWTSVTCCHFQAISLSASWWIVFLHPPICLDFHGYHHGDLDYKCLYHKTTLILSLNRSNIAPKSWDLKLILWPKISHFHSLMFLHLCACPSNLSKLLVASLKFSLSPASQCFQEPWYPCPPLSCQHLKFSVIQPWTIYPKL